MTIIRFPLLARGLISVKKHSTASHKRCVSTRNLPSSVEGAAWLKDPTYRKISPPNSIQWTMPTIPKDIRRPHYAESGSVSPWDDIVPLAVPIGPTEWYDKHLAKGMRNAGRHTAESLKYAVSLVKPGITTREIDRKLTEWAFSHRCYPSSLNYGLFPGSLCTSVNNVLSHGVPNEYYTQRTHLITVNHY
jgi:Metallopeptidase family M24